MLCWGSWHLNGWRLIRPVYLRCLALPCLSRGYWPTWLSRWTLLHGRRHIGTRLSLRRRARLDRRVLERPCRLLRRLRLRRSLGWRLRRLLWSRLHLWSLLGLRRKWRH